ncbi:hypothetical protein [Marinibacterium profundimaris]|uniref:Uncharacterized protein n=1 Tax=Marinibacterium profundimaris TaxID=1679460 RepID=A0A225NQW2_9RHOB|nr:hypothetical protein [Marinibacterium profundimaris]OWU77344.1 hypothetical protein ATO3_01050 [Marinibacterium profundimaris]
MRLLVILLLLLPGLAQAQWMRTGLEFHGQPPQPDPVVDRARVEAQQARRCEASAIRFGDTAAMRGAVAPPDWDDPTRTSAAIAAIADRPDTALQALDAAALTATTDEAATVLEAQAVLTALQFGQSPTVPTNDLSGPHLSDRLFWQALARAPTATPGQWTDQILPALDAAFAADPTSFQVRAWRVIAWLEARPPAAGQCAARIAAFSDRLLDLSEASACPLMLGHVTHAIDRALGSRPGTDSDRARATWRRFGEALLALVAGAPEVAAHRRAELTGAGGCAAMMGAELDALAREGER